MKSPSPAGAYTGVSICLWRAGRDAGIIATATVKDEAALIENDPEELPCRLVANLEHRINPKSVDPLLGPMLWSAGEKIAEDFVTNLGSERIELLST